MMHLVIAETEEEKRNHDSLHNLRNGYTGELTSAGETVIKVAVDLLNNVCFTNSDNHGWYEQYWLGDDKFSKSELGQRNFGEVIALITSELSEALEAYRDGDDQRQITYSYKEFPELNGTHIPAARGNGDDILGKPEGIAAELADAIIRICDYAGAYGVPLAEAIVRKHAYNFTRPYRHGGKLA